MTIGLGSPAADADDVVRLGSLARPRRPLSSDEPICPAFPSLLRNVSVTKGSHQGDPPSRLLVCGELDAVDVVSSLTMDLALSLASSQPCRCQGYRNHRGDSGGDHYDCRNCVAVVVFLPAVDDTFPMLCHSSEHEVTVLDDDAGGEEEDCVLGAGTATGAVAASLTYQPSQKNLCVPTKSQLQALRRIQIRRVIGMGEILQYLLQLGGLPVEQQPVGGILVDGIDRIVGQNTRTHANEDAASLTIRMTQIAALAVDTANCLERLHGIRPMVLISVCDDNAAARIGSGAFEENGPDSSTSVPTRSSSRHHFLAASSFWSPMQLQVLRRATPPVGRSPKAPTMFTTDALSHWAVALETKTVTAVSVHQHLEPAERYITWRPM